MNASPFRTAILAVSVLGLSGSLGSAAILMGTSSPVPGLGVDDDYDLTALGVSDWVIWNSMSTTDNIAATPTNSMDGGSLISNLTAVGGGTVRGSTSGTRPAADFSFTNGTPTASATINNAIGGFTTDIGIEGRGVSFTISLPTTDAYTVYVWGAAFETSTGTFTASLPEATDFTDTLISASNGNPKNTRIYTLTAQPDNAGDLLTVRLMLTTETPGAASSHVLFSAAAISVVPEPSTALMIAFGVVGVTLRRRREHTVS